jgi:hypothetical protein
MIHSDLYNFRRLSFGRGDLATLADFRRHCVITNCKQIARFMISDNLTPVLRGRGNAAARRLAAMGLRAAHVVQSQSDIDYELTTEARTYASRSVNFHE